MKLSDYRVQKYIYRFEMELFSMNETFDNIILTDINNNEIPIRNLIKTPKLIYRFSSKSCNSCVDSDIERIVELGSIIGHENIIIISDYENSRSLNIFKNDKELPFNCYNYEGLLNLSIEVESETKKAQFFFILNNENKVLFPFLGDEYPELNNAYFERIQSYFMNNLQNEK